MGTWAAGAANNGGRFYPAPPTHTPTQPASFIAKNKKTAIRGKWPIIFPAGLGLFDFTTFYRAIFFSESGPSDLRCFAHRSFKKNLFVGFTTAHRPVVFKETGPTDLVCFSANSGRWVNLGAAWGGELWGLGKNGGRFCPLPTRLSQKTKQKTPIRGKRPISFRGVLVTRFYYLLHISHF